MIAEARYVVQIANLRVIPRAAFTANYAGSLILGLGDRITVNILNSQLAATEKHSQTAARIGAVSRCLRLQPQPVLGIC